MSVPFSDIEFLAQTPYFQSCTREQLQEFAAFLKPVFLHSGQRLFYEGDQVSGWYLILKGEIAMVRRSPSGLEHILAEISEGEAFGEMSLLEKNPRMATAVAIGHVRLLKLEDSIFHQRLDVIDPVAVHMLRAMAINQSRRLREMAIVLQDLTDTNSFGDITQNTHPLDVNTMIHSGVLLHS